MAVSLFHQFPHKQEEMKRKHAGGGSAGTRSPITHMAPVCCTPGVGLKRKQTVPFIYLIRSKFKLLFLSQDAE